MLKKVQFRKYLFLFSAIFWISQRRLTLHIKTILICTYKIIQDLIPKLISIQMKTSLPYCPEFLIKMVYPVQLYHSFITL